jgi:hypothetical protein
MMVEYPATKVFTQPAPDRPGERSRALAKRDTRRLLLGADAQFTSWAQATSDFPDLQQQRNPALERELRAARGKDYLRANVFKISHHASKHGINIEVLERVGAELSLVSSSAGGGKYNFPHMLAMEATREARQATTSSKAQRHTDHELGIHLTGSKLDSGEPLGSIALLVPLKPSAHMRLFRLMDATTRSVDLAAAREVKP